MNFKIRTLRHAALALCLAATGFASVARASSFQDEAPASRSSSEVAKLLSSPNALQRRQAAEDLASASATEHLRLADGYRMQERDARVRLALDWALYRMGKAQALFEVVRALDTSRADQAQKYLYELESPDPLHIFLARTNGNTQIRLLEILARVGNAKTLELIKPFAASLDPTIVGAAEFAEREITIRLEEAPDPEPKRQRQTGKTPDEDTP